ncbi:MAG: 16S rRNA (uracil(1498)-N(3))-methyltransferase [Prevotellaceae bacterium]|nr:16S rRNA (uracil(1498)-N(3))-methyltransferase [Prevotellaceae bacterium]
MHLFYTPDIETRNELPQEEAVHAARVLRLQRGDEVTLTDGRGNFYLARIADATAKRCTVEVLERRPQAPLWTGHLHIALAPTKNMERVEWLVEKATEIGVDEITFLECRFSERRAVKQERVAKILIAAAKQSLKARLPRLGGMVPFDTFIQRAFTGQRFIAHCHEGEKPLLQTCLRQGGDALVLIGPEGDFSEEEVAAALARGFTPVSLGRSRLRTETAALVACHLMNMYNQIELTI